MAKVNGREWQHSNCRIDFSADGVAPFRSLSFSAIEYLDRAVKEAVKNADGKIVGYIIKDQETQGSVSMRLSEYEKLKAHILAANPDLGLGQVEMNMSVTYGDKLATTSTDKLSMVLFNEEAKKSEKDGPELMITIPLFIGGIKDQNNRSFIKYDAA